MREIEIKLKVSDLASIEKQLIEKGCAISDSISQYDVIYSLKSSTEEFESAKEGDVIIRIRHLKDKSELNLKKQKSNEMDNLEYETVVEDPKAMHLILTTLGWTPIIEIKKTRKKVKMGECEICLDTVDKLGTFIELEKMVDDDSSPDEVRAELFAIAREFGLSEKDEETKGYDTQIYLMQDKK